MPVTLTNITTPLQFGRLYAFCDRPADGAALSLTGGVPAGARTLDLGATQGEMVATFTPNVEMVDVEQLFGPIGPHVVSEVMQIRATLLEPSLRNLELVASQGRRVNYLDNASFEGTASGGLASGWTVSGTATPTVQADPQTAYGAQAQQFVTAGGVAGGIKQRVASHPRLLAGVILVYSVYAKAASGTPVLNHKIEAFDASDVSLGSANNNQTLSTSYARGSVAYTLPADTAYVVVTSADAAAANITCKLDNAQLEIVASGSTPTGVVGPSALFLGGKTDVLTYPVALVGQQPGTSKYTAVMLYDSYVTGGLKISKARGQVTAMAVEFTGIPVPSRSAGDRYGQKYEDQ